MGIDAINATTGYYVSPYSLNSLSPSRRRGLIAFGVLATLSVVLTLTVLILIGIKICKWRQNHRQFVMQNQCLILIMNLLFADLNQALAFTISFHWISVNGIFAPSGYCWVQAGLLHLGDVSSGFFVLTIALWTLFGVARGKRMGYKTFVFVVCLVWSISILLTIVGPLKNGEDFFALAGNWCWISQRYNDDRLWLHYLWVFIDEFGTVLIYLYLWVFLQHKMQDSRKNGANSQTLKKIMNAARYMLAYAMVYVVLTLPLATARMMALSGHDPPNPFLLVSGALLTSCGWLDALLYTLTRKVLIDERLNPKHGSDDRKPMSPLLHRARLGNHASATGGTRQIESDSASSSNENSTKVLTEKDGKDPDQRDSLPTENGRHKTSLRKGSSISIFNPLSSSIWRKTSINIYRSTDRASVESGVLPPDMQHYHNWVDPNDP